MPRGIIVDDFDKSGNRDVEDINGNYILTFASLNDHVEVLKFGRVTLHEKVDIYKTCIYILSKDLYEALGKEAYQNFQKNLTLQIGE